DLHVAEGRGSGIPKIQRNMRQNGSPEARFDFDEGSTYFRATLPVHPQYLVLHALRAAAHLWIIGERSQALEHLELSLEKQPNSVALVSQIIDYAGTLGELSKAETALTKYSQ